MLEANPKSNKRKIFYFCIKLAEINQKNAKVLKFYFKTILGPDNLNYLGIKIT
jgi:hypothetical protein